MSMSTIDRPPPIIRGPYVDPWPGVSGSLPPITSGRRAAPQMPVQASGGVAMPPNTAPTFESARLAVANGTRVFSVDTVSTPIIQRPTNIRNFLYLRNSSNSATAVVYVEFGANASTQSAVRLEKDEQLCLDAVVLQDDVTAISNEANASLSVMVSTVALPPGMVL